MAVMALLASWQQQVLSTAPADRLAAKDAVSELYRLLNCPPPRIVWVPSPADAVREAGLEIRSTLAPRILLTAFSSLARMTNRWRIPLAELAQSARQEPLQPDDAFRLASAIADASPFELRFRRGNEDVIVRHIARMVAGAPAFARSRMSPISAFLRGAMAPGIPAIIDVISEVLMIPEASQLVPLAALARSCGFCLPLEKTCFLCERPEFIRLDEQGQLHADAAPAVAWPGGAMPMWYWHGIDVAPHVLAPVNTMTASSIRRERSSIQRDIMIERFGLEAFIREAGTPVQRDESGVLWMVRSPLRRREVTVVEVTNGTAEADGSFRHYFLRVPNLIRTARGAVAWTYGLTAEEYKVAVRT